MKEYIIAGHKFALVEYAELTPKKENEINTLLNLDKVKEMGTSMNIEAEKIFPLILVSLDGAELDVSEITYNQMIKIMQDYFEAKQSFFDHLEQPSKPS
jgi:hypothetical protein